MKMLQAKIYEDKEYNGYYKIVVEIDNVVFESRSVHKLSDLPTGTLRY